MRKYGETARVPPSPIRSLHRLAAGESHQLPESPIRSFYGTTNPSWLIITTVLVPKGEKTVPLSVLPARVPPCELRGGHRLAGLLVVRQPGRRRCFLGQIKGAPGPPPCSHCGPGLPGPPPGDKTIRGVMFGEDPALRTSDRSSRTVPGLGAQQRRRDWTKISGEKISPRRLRAEEEIDTPPRHRVTAESK